MGVDDRLADRKAESHVSLAAVLRVSCRCGERAVEQMRQNLMLDAVAVVLDGEHGLRPLSPHGQAYLGRMAAAVHHGVLEQIGQHLRDEHRIHRHEQQILRHGNADADIRIALAELRRHRAEDLLRRLGIFDQARGRVAHARDAQQVFHDADEPLRVIPDVGQQQQTILLGQIRIFDHGTRRADDRGQRRADVMRDRTKQIRAHFFARRLDAQILLPLDLGRHRTGHERDHEHGQKGQRIARQREVHRPVRVGEYVVRAYDAQHGCERAEQIAGRKARDEQHGQDEDRVGEALRAVGHVQQDAQQHRTAEQSAEYRKIAPREGKDADFFR